mmetsp:Transcript_22901/g.53040  ORF Transcript_22901/g.53040 Transcript_22901/m.53040 type:complete len:155 (-) Transcript_22901:2740-3204(-)
MRTMNFRMERRIIRGLELAKKKRSLDDAQQRESLETLERKLVEFCDGVREWQREAGAKIQMLETRLEEECKTNTLFRSDTRQELEQLPQQHAGDQQNPVNAHLTTEQEDSIPVVYASPFVDHDQALLDSEVPLFGNTTKRKRRFRRRMCFWPWR